MMNGSRISLRIKPTVALTNPITSAAIRAAANPSTSIPGRTLVTINSATPLRTQCTTSRCMSKSYWSETARAGQLELHPGLPQGAVKLQSDLKPGLDLTAVAHDCLAGDLQ